MTKFEIYTLILCLIVFIMLVGVFSYLLTIIIKQMLKHIKAGLEDESIIKEFDTNTAKKPRKISKAFNMILNILLCTFFGLIFLSSLYINCTQNVYFDNFPTYRVVLTSSMENKNEKNKYLYENGLDNQISAFDLITTYKIPKEEDLKLYDIVVYEIDGILVVHRIVGIEEPNASHPNERHFLLQGDAVGSPDRFPVLYSQMQGIYKGEKIPFIGSFILFLQSPAGWLCILLIFSSLIITPILEKKLLKAKQLRLAIILAKPNEEQAQAELSVSAFSHLQGKKDDRTFDERLQELPVAKQRYDNVYSLVKTVSGVRTIESKKNRTFKSGNVALVRFNVRGKTLNAYLGLNPTEYVDTKYIYTDVSTVKKYENYPMRVKLTSERQLRWVKELLIDKVNKSGLTFVKDQEIVQVVSPFAHLKNKKNNKSFKQKLKLSPVAKARFNDIKAFIETIKGTRAIEGKYSVTYKRGNSPLVKFTVRGKTLNAYLGLNPTEFENTKYIFTDVSGLVKYKNYPMRVKVSSDRQVKWTKELISKIIDKGGKA